MGVATKDLSVELTERLFARSPRSRAQSDGFVLCPGGRLPPFPGPECLPEVSHRAPAGLVGMMAWASSSTTMVSIGSMAFGSSRSSSASASRLKGTSRPSAR